MPCPKSQFKNMAEPGFKSRSFYDSTFYKGVLEGRKCQNIKHGPVLAVVELILPFISPRNMFLALLTKGGIVDYM